MKKMIFALALALPMICLGQDRGDIQLRNSNERQERGGSSQDIRADKMSQGGESYHYLEVMVITRGNEEQVTVNLNKTLMSQITDKRELKNLEMASRKEYPNLVSALNNLSGEGWNYLDSYQIGNPEEPIVKVILRKPKFNKEERRR